MVPFLIAAILPLLVPLEVLAGYAVDVPDDPAGL